MELTVKRKYLTIPVNVRAAQKKICFYDAGELVYDLDCKIDMLNPTFTAFVDMERFIGRTLDVTVSPEMNYEFGFSDVMDLPGLYSEPYRPQIHFTVANGFNNDPNGLVYLNGKYHMFCQYNPCAPEWGNMHWNHAVSTDLVHWEEKGIALFPDDMGTMYSGSAIIDRDNLLGLQTGDIPVMLLFYTAAGDRNLMSQLKGNKRTQCLAYSTDGGETFRKYAGNPVVPFFEAYNRDPKVVYVPELGKYLMTIFMVDNRYRMLTSTDFLHWETLQEIELPNESECPDIYPLECGGEKKWVLSGASDVYIVGSFENGRFAAGSTEKKLTYSTVTYAAQSFSGLPGGDTVRIFWDRTNVINEINERFRSQMSIPVKMSLEKIGDEYYLAALPVKETESLRDRHFGKSDFVLSEALTYETGANPLDIVIKADYDEDATVKLGLFGHTLRFDMKNNTASASCGKDVKMPVSVEKKTLDLRIIADRVSVEVYADGGKLIYTSVAFCDYNLPRVTLSSDKPVKIDSFDVYTMKSIWR